MKKPVTTVISIHDPDKFSSDYKYAMIYPMNGVHLEPGLIRVFRWFAWLRLAALGMIPIIILRSTNRLDGNQQGILPILVTVIDVLILLLYLYLPILNNRLGKYFFPVGIIIASITILLEQYLFLDLAIGWHLYPFLFVLLILVAWQYRFRDVVVYSILVAVYEIFLILFTPSTIAGLTIISSQLLQVISIGLVFSRTIIYLVLGYVVTFLMKSQREQQKALAEANQKLVQHAGTLEQLTTSRERNRLSRELHDTLAHSLSAMVVQIEAIQIVWEPIPTKASGMLEQLLTTARSGLDETRRALRALRASPLEELGLELAVRSLMDDIASRCGYQVSTNVSGDLEDLSPDVEQCYYRIAQEALANAANHASASRISLVLERNSNKLRMEILDDGTGFSQNHVLGQNGSKYGIQGMRERAELIGARFEIQSVPGSGTAVRVLKDLEL